MEGWNPFLNGILEVFELGFLISKSISETFQECR